MQSSSFRLVVRRGPQPNQVYPLEQGVVTLGRDITNHIVINDPEVSRHHCRLTQGGGGYTVEDLGSTNGTFVNGQRLTGAHPLMPGDTLGLGETVTLAYEAADAGLSAVPGPAQEIAGGPPAPGAEFAPPGGAGYAPPQPGAPSVPPGGYPGAAMAGQPPYDPAQPQAGYDYYQDEIYDGGGAGRWLVLACGCLLVLCIATTVIGGIIIDAKCWWDDIPVISEMFDLGIKEGATCR